MAPVLTPRYRDQDELTGGGIVNIISYWPASQRTCWYDAHICLGETQTNTLNRFDLCYSFKMLCQVEYGGTCQLHLAVKNYAHNYTYSARLHQNQWITYKRALRNLTVLMFSHYVHQLENSGSLKGHQTLIVHECLQVAAALSQYHRSRRSSVRMPTGTRYQQLPRTISDTSTVWHSCSWVRLKTQCSPTLNSSDAVTTTSIIMSSSLVICRREGNCPLRSSQRKCTLGSTRRWSPGLKIALTCWRMQGLSVPFACVGSGDPVRVLCLYTTNTLDTL